MTTTINEEDGFGKRNLSSPIFFRAKNMGETTDIHHQHVTNHTLLLPTTWEILAQNHAASLLHVQHIASITDIPLYMQDLEMLVRMLLVNPSTTQYNNDYGDDDTTTSTLLLPSKYALYAATVLSNLPVDSLGPQICDLLSRNPTFCNLAPDMARKCSERARFQSSGGTTFHQLPFREETDSRNHFLTQEQRALYKCRETLRDIFGTSLNRVISNQRSLNPLSRDACVDVIRQCARACVVHLKTCPAVIAWFARMILEHLCRVAQEDQRELDRDVVRLFKDVDQNKIDKLSRRMMGGGDTSIGFDTVSSSASTATIASSSTISPSNLLRTSSLNGNNNVALFRASSLTSPSTATTTTPTTTLSSPDADLDDIFPHIGERFFASFLRECDSHVLCSAVARFAHAEIKRLSQPFSSGRIPTPTTFAERCVLARVLARMLGFIVFYPRWPSSVVAYDNRTSSSAFRALYGDLLSYEECNAQHPVNVLDVLSQARVDGTVLFVVPWICAFLRLVIRDAAVASTQYIKSVFMDLAVLRVSSRLQITNGFGALRAGLEIDSLFMDLSMQVWSSTILDEAMLLRVAETTTDSERVQGQQPDSMPMIFDACDLDCSSTTCTPLERIRCILLDSMRAPVVSVPPSRKLLPTNVFAVADSGGIGGGSTSSSISFFTQSSHHGDNNVRPRLEALFLMDEEIAKAIEFVIAVIPESACSDDLVQQCVGEALADVRMSSTGGSTVTEMKLRHKALEAAVGRVYVDMETPARAILNLSCPTRSLVARDAALDIALRRAEPRCVRILDGKIQAKLRGMVMRNDGLVGNESPSTSTIATGPLIKLGHASSAVTDMVENGLIHRIVGMTYVRGITAQDVLNNIWPELSMEMACDELQRVVKFMGKRDGIVVRAAGSVSCVMGWDVFFDGVWDIDMLVMAGEMIKEWGNHQQFDTLNKVIVRISHIMSVSGMLDAILEKRFRALLL